jgi:hypothetical protein
MIISTANSFRSIRCGRDRSNGDNCSLRDLESRMYARDGEKGRGKCVLRRAVQSLFSLFNNDVYQTWSLSAATRGRWQLPASGASDAETNEKANCKQRESTVYRTGRQVMEHYF